MNTKAELSSLTMAEIVTRAWSMRTEFDLTGVGYGRKHWGDRTGVIAAPFPYYFFLAGMVRLTGASRVVDVGTHHGGSARALAAGLPDDGTGRIVTFDITRDGARLLAGHHLIRAHTIDGNSELAYRACVQDFGDAKIDLAYIDAQHAFWPTLLSVLIYEGGLDAEFLILDDITLNAEMCQVWEIVQLRYGRTNAIDASEVCPEIRPGNHKPGFGVVRSRTRDLRRV